MDILDVYDALEKAIINSGLIKNCENFFKNSKGAINYQFLYDAGIVFTKERQETSDRSDPIQKDSTTDVGDCQSRLDKTMRWGSTKVQIEQSSKNNMIALKRLFRNIRECKKIEKPYIKYVIWGNAYSIIAYLTHQNPSIKCYKEKLEKDNLFNVTANLQFGHIENIWKEFVRSNIDCSMFTIPSDAGDLADALANNVFKGDSILKALCYSIKNARNAYVHVEDGYRDCIIASVQGSMISMIEAYEANNDKEKQVKESALKNLGKVTNNVVETIPPIVEHEPQISDFEEKLQEIRELQRRISKVSFFRRQYTSSWTIYNEELNSDLYLQAGKEENNDIKIYIFKIKGKTYTEDAFEINDERFFGKSWAKPNPNKRDIIIDLRSFKEQRKKVNPIDFSKHLWKTIDFTRREIIDNPNYDKSDL